MVDTHTHHLDLRRFGYPWLAAAEYEPLRRDYLPGDYLADVAGAPVEGWVHVQAEIDRSVDPASETQWVSGLAADARAAGLPGPLACVVYADLKAPDLVEALGRQCGSPETRGVREEVWFDPGSTRIDAARENLLADPGWREGYRMLAHFGLLVRPARVARATAGRPASGTRPADDPPGRPARIRVHAPSQGTDERDESGWSARAPAPSSIAPSSLVPFGDPGAPVVRSAASRQPRGRRMGGVLPS